MRPRPGNHGGGPSCVCRKLSSRDRPACRESAWMRRGCPAKQRRSGRLARPAVNMELHILAGSRTEAPLALDGTGRTSTLKPVSAAGWETSQVSPLQWSHQIGEGTVCIVRNGSAFYDDRLARDNTTRGQRAENCQRSPVKNKVGHLHESRLPLLAMIWLPHHTHPP